MNSNPAPNPKGHILIVDDKPDNVQLLSETLSAQGYKVRGVLSGAMALRVVRSVPDLILLDIMMPEMDGYEVCKTLKAAEATRDIPVIFLSALDDVAGKVKAFTVGGIDYITKPFQIEEVLARVENHLTLRQLQKQLTEQNSQLQQEVRDRLLAEAQLKQAKETAETANQAKSEFLAKMSHELRTPLNAILGFTQILSHDLCLEPKQRENLDIISRSGEHLLKLIENILDLSKIEAGKIALNQTNCNLYSLLNTLEEMLSLKAATRDLQLLFERAASVPEYVKVDEGKLRQVLINLLGNAIKFTDEGRVTLRVSVRGNGEQTTGNGADGSESSEREVGNKQLIHPAATQKQTTSFSPHPSSLFLHFEVEDTGSGIPAEELETLFEAFVQNPSQSGFQEGTGLGLPISQQFVRLMGGELIVRSQVGRGTTFEFDVAIEPSDERALKPSNRRAIALEPGQPDYRILVVEDRLESRQLLLKLLQPVGFEVRAAENGAEAIDLWENWQPHFIWMDVRMPVMDGYEATQQIRAREQAQLATQDPTANLEVTSSPVTIIALTAYAFESDRDAALSVGCNDFVSKPLQEQTILDKIATHLGVRYVYEEDSLIATNGRNFSAPSLEMLKAQLSAMSPEWSSMLHQAAVEADAEVIFRLIEKLGTANALLADSLVAWVNNFEYDKILELAQMADKFQR